ncbi:MAG: hypothetical protein IAE79_05030 [Anaerolinea sp.]|nr:hypothetical protein [Anaerolinea sp.]
MVEIDLNALLEDIHILTEQLSAFEERYGLLSEVFYDWYSVGNEPENDAWVMDFTEWAGLYRSRQLLMTEYRSFIQKRIVNDQNAINRHLRSYAAV